MRPNGKHGKGEPRGACHPKTARSACLLFAAEPAHVGSNAITFQKCLRCKTSIAGSPCRGSRADAAGRHARPVRLAGRAIPLFDQIAPHALERWMPQQTLTRLDEFRYPRAA